MVDRESYVLFLQVVFETLYLSEDIKLLLTWELSNDLRFLMPHCSFLFFFLGLNTINVAGLIGGELFLLLAKEKWQKRSVVHAAEACGEVSFEGRVALRGSCWGCSCS